jgi:hypothetical protein
VPCAPVPALWYLWQGAKGSLPEACRVGDVAAVNLLLAKKKGAAAVNLETEDGVTPLAIAAAGDHLEVIAALLKAGANVNLTMKVPKSVCGSHPSLSKTWSELGPRHCG